MFLQLIVRCHQSLLLKQVKGNCQTEHILRQFEQKLRLVTLGISLGTNAEVRALISKLCEKLQRDRGKRCQDGNRSWKQGCIKPEGKDMQPDYRGLTSYCLSSEHR